MSMHELELGSKDVGSSRNLVVYVIPRSSDSHDYALISPLREKEILRNGLEANIEFQGYAPVLEGVEAKVKEFLHNKLSKGFHKNLSFRRKLRWASASGILFCLLFVFSGMIDDLIFDPMFLSIIGYTFYRQMAETSNFRKIQSRIEEIKFTENPLLTAMFNDFSCLESGDYRATDWEAVFSQMPAEQRDATIQSLSSYIDYDNRRKWQLKLAYLGCNQEQTDPLTRFFSRLMCFFYRKRLDNHTYELKHRKMLKPGYYEIIEHLIEHYTFRTKSLE